MILEWNIKCRIFISSELFLKALQLVPRWTSFRFLVRAEVENIEQKEKAMRIWKEKWLKFEYLIFHMEERGRVLSKISYDIFHLPLPASFFYFNRWNTQVGFINFNLFHSAQKTTRERGRKDLYIEITKQSE